jgi:hypothetical protein
MERALQKLAQQLNQYDSSSLTSLWDRYAHIVARFEPTKRWEEAVLSFCMIQAVHWKNQLFNCGMIENQQRAEQDRELEKQLRDKLESLSGGRAPAGAAKGAKEGAGKAASGAGGGGQKPQRRKILLFPVARNGGKS